MPRAPLHTHGLPHPRLRATGGRPFPLFAFFAQACRALISCALSAHVPINNKKFNVRSSHYPRAPIAVFHPSTYHAFNNLLSLFHQDMYVTA